MAEPSSLAWVPCRLGTGHGVASGRSPTSPYPAGTIALQSPLFLERGLDLSPFFPGTLNLEAQAGVWRLRHPDARIDNLRWTEHHPPETFSFWRCRLRPAAGPEVEALIYHPHPETKRAHHQAEGCLELLAPWLGPLSPGTVLELGVDPQRCRLIDPARLRARLLEFLKFRVLAAQADFFTAFQATAQAGAASTGTLEPALVRHWLGSLWPEALDLSDADLLTTLEQAHRLYVN